MKVSGYVYAMPPKTGGAMRLMARRETERNDRRKKSPRIGRSGVNLPLTRLLLSRNAKRVDAGKVPAAFGKEKFSTVD
jgi:hypothetical protein